MFWKNILHIIYTRDVLEFSIVEVIENSYPLNMHFNITINAAITEEIAYKQYYVCLKCAKANIHVYL